MAKAKHILEKLKILKFFLAIKTKLDYIMVMINKVELTEKEKVALAAFQEGMDEPNAGWLHEIAPFEGKELSGVVSSLVKKGVITSDSELINQDPSNVCYWIQVCDAWRI